MAAFEAFGLDDPAAGADLAKDGGFARRLAGRRSPC